MTEPTPSQRQTGTAWAWALLAGLLAALAGAAYGWQAALVTMLACWFAAFAALVARAARNDRRHRR